VSGYFTGCKYNDAACYLPGAKSRLFSEQQAVGIGRYPATDKIGEDFPVTTAFKGALLMADCFPGVSRLRSCLFGDFSSSADTRSSFKNFS
jgi:hypothetical protein